MTTDTKTRESYRDRVSTIDEEGKRVWVYPRKPSGKLHRARAVVAFFLLAFLFGAPFIKVNGEPFILLNIIERKFVIFGVVFWPQDFHLFALSVLTLFVFIILFTAVFGRVWCGWACPQTIFMEMVFRKIDYLIEGDAAKQRALNRSPLTGQKLFKKSLKHIIFYSISFLIGNTFLAYIIGVDQLYKIITDPPSQHIVGLTAMILFSGVFYFVFAFFREQACTMVCPYGRLQGVMLDSNSIVVMYDFQRGEPRGKIKKNIVQENLGDCVDCTMCVQVCPTGIDIRNGTQLECVNCTACIDACNDVMSKVNRPTGLIRYDSYNGVSQGTKLKFTPRIAGYSSLLVILLALITFLMSNRTAVEATILRTPGVLYQELEGNRLQNLYNIQIVNKTSRSLEVHVQLHEPEGEIMMVSGQTLRVPEHGLAESAILVKLPAEQVKSTSTNLVIGVYDGDELIEKVKTKFLGPHR